ncbi:MAG: apolipoprotein N-acyltransferase [Epsilonproteobacteria bacterium]|nr:MAG: apolipoprotein N-acyltransferase [Campylobacterota bacterium]
MSRVVPWETFINKIRQYFSTFVLIRGLLISALGSSFIYLAYWNLSFPFVNTLLALTALYLLLQEDRKIWFISGAFIGLFWFWWIALSLEHYGMTWAVPIELFIIMLSYGFLFWLIAYLAEKSPLGHTAIKALGLLLLSYVHPFGFDWLKPELMFVQSYLGIHKWQFFIILATMVLSIYKKQLLYLFFLILAYQPTVHTQSKPLQDIVLISTQTTVQEKWNKDLHKAQFEAVFSQIDKAIAEKKTLIVFPESIFPIFLNRSQDNLKRLKAKAKNISIVIGGLYWDGKTPRNSSYIFTKGKVSIANKVLLVPFGESNPLPDFLSDWVNKVFYDGAIDYKASTDITDYYIDSVQYRNAICFEATAEKLYEGNPARIIVISNNGWFTPSTEPTLQKLLLVYYSKKYGTTIYHAVNMSASYIIQKGKVLNP